MKIFCIGRNYVDHAKELNNPVPKQPLVFMKPATAICQEEQIPYPAFSNELHYELELVLKISNLATKVPLEEAQDFYQEIGLGIDYTARDIQRACKQKGHSWEKAKAFDNSASFSPFRDKSTLNLAQINFHLELNGAKVQDGKSSDMIFGFDFLVHHVSQYFTLEKGDLIMTGTPAGVGPLQTGDELKCYLEGELILHNSIISK